MTNDDDFQRVLGLSFSFRACFAVFSLPRDRLRGTHSVYLHSLAELKANFKEKNN